MSQRTVQLTLTYDQALVLFDFFARWEKTERLEFGHVAEYLVLTRIAAQLDKSVIEMFDPAYVQLLAAARDRVAGDYEGDYPGPKSQAADV